MAVLGCAGRSWYSPRQGRRGDQHLTRNCTGFAHRIPCGTDTRAATRGLITEKRARLRLLNFDLLPIGLELLSENHRQCGANALSHLRSCDHDGYFVVRSDPQIGIGRKLFARFVSVREVEADQEARPGGNPRANECASRERRHRAPAGLAARWMALRIRS